MSVVSFTGHRPNKIGGYKIPNPTYNYITAELRKLLIELKPDKAISGMALGIDTFAAEICIELGIPLTCAVPFLGQESIWPTASQTHYSKLLKAAHEVVVVSTGGYSPQKMQIRNQWMTDRCDLLIAVYNGDKTGGTANCVNYARSIGKQLYIIDPTKAPL